MKKFIQFTAVFALFVAAVFTFTQLPAVAQSTGLRINPRTDLSVRPGESQSGSLLIANLNKDVSVTVDLNVVDFKATGETGTPTPVLEENAEPTPWSLKPFLNTPDSVTLKAGETKYVPYSVRIPSGQGAGSYYSAIKYDPRPSEQDENVVVSGAPMQLVFVTVPGRTTEVLNLKEFGAYQRANDQTDGSYKSIFISSQPDKVAYLLQNQGNVAENPTGTIVVKNMFGNTVTTIDNANPKANLALIDQTRRFEVCIDSDVQEVDQDGRTTRIEQCKSPGFMPGMYTAEMNLYYGINGSTTQEITAKATFWYLPIWFLAIVLLVLAVLAYVIYKVRSSLVGRTRHVRKR